MNESAVVAFSPLNELRHCLGRWVSRARRDNDVGELASQYLSEECEVRVSPPHLILKGESSNFVGYVARTEESSLFHDTFTHLDSTSLEIERSGLCLNGEGASYAPLLGRPGPFKVNDTCPALLLKVWLGVLFDLLVHYLGGDVVMVAIVSKRLFFMLLLMLYELTVIIALVS